MPTQNSRYYNNPQIGQAFNNLAQMFAPPSGGDLAGYATADAKRQEAARLAELFTYAQDPSVNQNVFDRMGQATGQWTPSTGYYGVDTTAATTRRGQDISAQTEIEKQRLSDAGALARLYATPVTAAEGATVYLPEQTAGAAGLPRVLTGNIAAAQGERITTPDGRVIEGAAKPLSATEVEGQILQGLPDADQRAKVLGDIPIETIIMNGQPTIVRRNDAVGQQPAPTQSAAAPETQNYQTPTGERGTAVFDRAKNTWVDTATGASIPQGSITFNSSLQGGAADTGLGPTTANSTAANDQAAQITQALNTLDVYEQLIRQNPGALGLVGVIRGTAQNAVASAQDLTAAFGKSAPQVAKVAAEIKSGLSEVAPEIFDPSIPEANFLRATLAYAIARTENPDGEVSRQAYERALERMSGGMLGNSQEALANIGAYRKVLQQQIPGVNALRDPSAARTDTTFQAPAGADAPVERWIRGPDGRPVRAQ